MDGLAGAGVAGVAAGEADVDGGEIGGDRLVQGAGERRAHGLAVHTGPPGLVMRVGRHLVGATLTGGLRARSHNASRAAAPARTVPDGSRRRRARGSALAGGDLLGQLRHDLEQVAHDAEVDEVEDRAPRRPC